MGIDIKVKKIYSGYYIAGGGIEARSYRHSYARR